MSFFIEHFWTILGIVTGLGGAGIVIALILLGVPAALIVANIIGFFKAVIEFFKTPLGQLMAIVAVCVLCAFIADIHRRQADVVILNKQLAQRDRQWQAKVDEAASKFRDARDTRDKSVDTDLQNVVAAKSAEIETLQAKVSTYEGPDHPGCVLTPADLSADGVQQNGTAAAAAAAGAKPTRRSWRFPFGHRR